MANWPCWEMLIFWGEIAVKSHCVGSLIYFGFELPPNRNISQTVTEPETTEKITENVLDQVENIVYTSQSRGKLKTAFKLTQ